MRDGSLRSLLEDYAHPPPPPSLLLLSRERWTRVSACSLFYTYCLLSRTDLPAPGARAWSLLVVRVLVCQAIQPVLHRETTHTNGQDRPPRTKGDAEWVCWGQLPYGIAFIERRTTVSGYDCFSNVRLVASQILGILKGPDARN